MKQKPNNPLSNAVQTQLRQALAFHQNGQLAQAAALYQAVLRQQPQHFDALHLLGVIAAQSGDPLRAAELIGQAVRINSASAPAFNNLGNAQKDIGRFEDALRSFDRAIALSPAHADTHYNRGMVLQALGRHEDALLGFERVIKLNPGFADAHAQHANTLYQLGRLEPALQSYDRAITLDPAHADACCNRGIVLQLLGRNEEALRSFDAAITARPEHAAAYANRGNVLHQLRQLDASLQSYGRATALQPDFAAAWTGRGVVLQEQGRFEEALQSHDRAIALDPGLTDAYVNRGGLLEDMKRFDDALHSYDRALTLDPGYPFLPGVRLIAQMAICDWRDADSRVKQLEHGVADKRKVTSAFALLALSGSPELQRRAAELWAADKFPSGHELPQSVVQGGNGKIRIGYFSADFRLHAVSILMAGVFEQHDRDRFEVVGFSFGPLADDAMKHRIVAAFDRFIEVGDKSDREIAELARSLGIDIAIDLGGYTQYSRTGIFALRAAPVQIGYIGYLGTMGADYIDYLLADAVLAPPDARQFYTEKIAYLPSYQANDAKREIAERVFTRTELGLPETGFVFCCFNNNYKITPKTFDGWMRILGKVEGSVLMLYVDNDAAIANLKREAEVRGIAAERLVFAERLPQAEYLARYRTADLFLDTLPYNAGATASDALWAGLPVLTCKGDAFASRMAASLLTSIGLPELITNTQEEYESLAVELATQPERLGAIREKLARNRLTQPLFDTVTITRNLEAVYVRMHERNLAGLPPDHLENP